jgi:hypothetical protein
MRKAGAFRRQIHLDVVAPSSIMIVVDENKNDNIITGALDI